MKEKSYNGSKIIIIILSLIFSLNGLGLIVAGIRTKKNSWTVWGIIYIIFEWILCIIASGVTIIMAFIISVICIIHTALICGRYGELLNDKNEARLNNNFEIQPTTDKKDDIILQPVDNAKTFEKHEEHIKTVSLPIGRATVVYNDGKPSIIINSKKEYEFITNGRAICEARISDGSIYRYE